MLAGVLAGQNLTTTLTGDSSLQARPMGRVIEPLREMGARVDSRDGKPPITISGTNELRAINYALPVASAQVKSCLMLAGLLAHGRTEVSEPLGVTRDHTERMMKWFGIPLETEVTSDVAAGPRIGVVGPVSFAARDVSIPGDISSAAFLIAAAALLPRSDVVIEDVGLNPTRTQFLATLRSLGLAFEVTSEREKCNEPIGTLRVTGATQTAAEARPVIVGGAAIAQLIDELPLLAVVGSQTDGGIEIREASELRLKESDRIAATVKNLRAMGAMVEETADGMLVGGPTQLHGAVIDSYGDHRIAMAFSVAALLASGESEIEGAECVSVSFPEFFNLLESIVER